MALKNLIYQKIQSEKQVSRNALRAWAGNLRTPEHPHGRDISTVDRKARELTNEGKIKPLAPNRFIEAYKLVEDDKKSVLSDKFGLKQLSTSEKRSRAVQTAFLDISRRY